MYCPKCNREYFDDIVICPVCGSKLIYNNSQSQTDSVNFITVYSTGNPAIIAFAKSLLESEGIRYRCKGEGLQDLFALGRLGSGYNPIIGPVEIQVEENDFDLASQILINIEENNLDNAENNTDIFDKEQENIQHDKVSISSTKRYLVIFLMGLLISGIIFYIYDYKQKHFSGVLTYDLNNDGEIDQYLSYDNGTVVIDEGDRNFDGKIDYTNQYNDGIFSQGKSDDDFDGLFETSYVAMHGFCKQVMIDKNQDNDSEIVEYYSNGIIYEKIWQHQTKRFVWKKVLYEAGIEKEEYVDLDYDGKFDIKIIFIHSGPPIFVELTN